MSISTLISLLSGIALFLFGMSLMGDGLKKVAGNKLEVILYQLTGKPLKGFLLGTAVTAVIQSSSATSVMVVGFVNSGMMRVRQAISILQYYYALPALDNKVCLPTHQFPGRGKHAAAAPQRVWRFKSSITDVGAIPK